MTALELLRTLRKAGDDIQSLREQVEMRESAATFITAHYGDAPGGGASAPGDKFINYADAIGNLREQMLMRKKRWCAEMEYCIQLAGKYEGLERMIVFNYYGRAWTLAAIAKSEGYSEGAVKKAKCKMDGLLGAIPVERGQMPEDYWRALE